jgi:hypothetical protein
MDFIDKNIRINFLPEEGKPLSFKAYIEKSDITYQILEQNIEIVPTTFTNDTIATRVLQNLDLVFNVFSESRREAYDNYVKLHELIHSLKPIYKDVNSEYRADDRNTFGLMKIDFDALPIIKQNGSNLLEIYVKSFSYLINQEMGFIQMNYPVLKNEPDKIYSLDVGPRSKLVPIAFKISLGGRILLDYDDTSRTPKTRKRARGGREEPESGGEAPPDLSSFNQEEKENARAYYTHLYGDDIDIAKASANVLERYKLIKNAVEENVIEKKDDGSFKVKNPNALKILINELGRYRGYNITED